MSPTAVAEEDDAKEEPSEAVESHHDEDDSDWMGTGVIQHADAMKAQVKKHLLRPRYNVADLYHKEGAFQAIARSSFFDNFTLAVIAINAIWIAIDTDLNTAEVLLEAESLFQVVDHMFCTFFLTELFIRFMSFRRKCDCLRDTWFLFDAVLVGMMVCETWLISGLILVAGISHAGNGLGNAYILRIARLLRLSRMARVVRLLRVMPELLILVKGMVAATRSVFFTLCLLVVLLYVFGIALRQLAEGTEAGEAFFPTVAQSMYTLLIYATFLDHLGILVEDVGKDSGICAALIWVFVFLGPLTVLNMLIGILCEVVSTVASIEKEANVVSFTKDKMGRLFEALDESGDGLISRDEFFSLVQKPETARLLTEVGVDVVGLIDEADAIFTEMTVGEDGEQAERQLTFMDLMEVVLELRGSNHVSVKHIVQLRKHVLTAIAQTNKTLSRLESVINTREKGGMRRQGARMYKGVAPMTSTDSKQSTDCQESPSVDTVRPAEDSFEMKDAGFPESLSKQSTKESTGLSRHEDWVGDLPTVYPTRPNGFPSSLPMDFRRRVSPACGSPVRFAGLGWQGVVDRLEEIVTEARAEIQRELACGAAVLGHAQQPRPVGTEGIHQCAPPSAGGQQVVCVLNAREWSELRGKLAGVAGGAVPGVAELRRICVQLEAEEEAPDQLLEPRRCKLLKSAG